MFNNFGSNGYTGGKAGTLRAYNRKLIFNFVASNGPVSRSVIAHQFNLSITAVTDILNELKDVGLIRFVGYGPSQGGRPPLLVEASSDSLCILGLSIDVGYTRAILAGPSGETLGKDKQFSVSVQGPNAVVQQMIEMGVSLIEQYRGNRTLIAIGLAVSAPVNPAGVFHPPDMEGWENLERPVVEILSETFGVKGLVDNDANLGALAEMRFGEYSDSRNLAYVLIHRGVGAGIVSDGKILRGAANWAGELGHMVIDPDGPRCSCGNFGCLESFVYSRKLVEYTIQEVKFGRPSSLQEKDTEQLHSDDIINAALAGDQAATVAIQKLGDWLGIGLANLISLFNPEVIVLGGALTQAGDILLEPARLIARNRVLPDLRPLVKIEMSSFGQNGPLLGAVASSLDLLLEQEILIPSNSGVINA